MTNIIKKITVALLSLVVVAGAFAPAASAFAASFNNDSQDYPTLQVSNYSRNPGSNSNWSSSVSAAAGEIVSFLVYYHNTASDTANGTTLLVQLPSGSITSTSVTGEVRANNASTANGSVSVSLSSGQTMTFIPGSVSWYPDKSTSPRALLNGQSGIEIVSQGLSVGNIAGGWPSQGYVVFRAQISNNNNGGGNNPTGSAPSVNTTPAFSVTQTSAAGQGTVNPNNANTNAWFEYGATQSLGSVTGQQTVGSGNASTNISGYFNNLTPNTTYYYRAVAQNSYGTTHGSVLSFTTYAGSYGSIASVSTNSATSISQNYATLQGTVNPNNSNTTAWFEYGTTQSFGSTAGHQTVGSGNYLTNISGYLNNLAPNTTYYYRAVAQNSYGTSYGTVLSFTTQSGSYGSNGSAPLVYTNSANGVSSNSVTFTGSVNPNGSYTNAWFEYGLTQSLGYTAGYQSIGSGSYASTLTSTAYNLAPNTTYYYRAVAQNSYGTSYGTTMTVVTGGSSVGVSGNAPYVTTRAAQSVFRNSALINGNVNPNGSLATAWFDWGTTATFGNRTIIMPVGQATYADSYSAVLSGLQAGTTYYYRAVSQNAYGTTYGHTLNFTTTADPIVPVVINNPTPVEPRIIVQQTTSGVAPTVILTPSIDKKNPRGGDKIEYMIQYRNEMASPITNVTLKVELPNEVRYDTATLKPSVTSGNVLTFDLGTITANTQGVITVKATIDRDVDAEDTLIFGATINYTNAKKQFQSATAYLTVMVGAGFAGLASLLSVFGDLFTNWFVDLILGLLIGFGIYHFFVRQKEEEVLVK